MQLTQEQKAKFGPMLQYTWEAIASDAQGMIDGEGDRAIQIAAACLDANLVQIYGEMNNEDYKILCAASREPDTIAWFKQILNY